MRDLGCSLAAFLRRSGAAPADVVLARRPDGGDWSKNDDGSLEWLTPTKGSPNLSLYSPATGYAPGGTVSVAPYGTACSAFCAASGQSCDEAATQALAASVGACEAAVTQLGLGWESSGDYADDDAGCVFIDNGPGDRWVQVMDSDGLGTGVTTTCASSVSSGKGRVCACAGGNPASPSAGSSSSSSSSGGGVGASPAGGVASCSMGFAPLRIGSWNSKRSRSLCVFFEASKKRGCTVQNYGSAKSGRAAVMDVIGDVAARYASTPPLPCPLRQR